MFLKKFKFYITYAVCLLFFCLIASEIFLRFIIENNSDKYYIWTPNLEMNFEPSQEATPGVSGTGNFKINSMGIRSDELPDKVDNIIYVLGGSTAIEVYLDQKETWTNLLQTKLNNNLPESRSWIGNLSKSSLASIHNLMYFDYLLPQLPKGKLFINLIGVNDLQLALKSSYLRDMSYKEHMSWAFSHVPNNDWIKTLATVRFYYRIKNWLQKRDTGLIQTHNADGFIAWKKCRQSAPPEKIINTLPDLTEESTIYRKNLNKLVDSANNYGAPMIFLTQPSIWKENMSDDEFKLLLAGGVGPNNEWCVQQAYYSPTVLSEGMELYNQTLLDVCKERKLFCIDLAKKLPKEKEYFYDDIHFSEAGSKFISDIIIDELTNKNEKVINSL